jgi:hypothetical protein
MIIQPSHPSRLRLHVVPASSSWIDLAELRLAELTNRELRRAVHRIVTEMQAGIRAWINARNADPKPFVSAKTPDEILDVPGVAIRAVTSGSACHHSAFIRTGLILQPPYSPAACGARRFRLGGGEQPWCLQDQLVGRRDADDLDFADSDMRDEFGVPPDDRPDGFGRSRRLMSLAFDRDGCLVHHVPPHGRRLEVTGAIGGGDGRLEVRPAIVSQARVGPGGHAGGDLELAQSLAGSFGLWPACCQQRLDRASEPDWAGGELGVRRWELVPLAPFSD